MANKTGIRMKRRAFSTKYIGDAFIKENRRTFQEWGDEVVRGYRSIVSNWSSESKPKFVPRIRYMTDTTRFFVYIDLKGDAVKQIGRWEAVDFGLSRSGRAVKKQTGVPSFVQLPRGVGMKKLSDFDKPQGVKRRQAEKMQRDAFQEYEKELQEKYSVKNKNFTRRGMPMRVHTPKTDKGVQYGGPGTYRPAERYVEGSGEFGEWKFIPIVPFAERGNIEPRMFTRALYFLTLGRGGPGGTIWNPKKVHWANTVRRAYDRGVRASNKRARSAAGSSS